MTDNLSLQPAYQTQLSIAAWTSRMASALETPSNNEISEQEHEFVQTVAETFNIDTDEYKRCLAFIQSSESDDLDISSTLIIDNSPTNPFKNARHIYSDNITGQLRVLNIPSVNMFTLSHKSRVYGIGWSWSSECVGKRR